MIAKYFVILTFAFSLLVIDAVCADPAKVATDPKRLEITLPDSLELGGNTLKVSKIDQQQFVALFGKVVESFNADSKKFGVDAASALTRILDYKTIQMPKVYSPSAQCLIGIYW